MPAFASSSFFCANVRRISSRSPVWSAANAGAFSGTTRKITCSGAGFSPKYCVLRTSVSVRPASQDPRRYGPFASGFRLRGCAATSPPAHAAAERSGRLKASSRPAEAVLEDDARGAGVHGLGLHEAVEERPARERGRLRVEKGREREDDVLGGDGRAVLPAGVLSQADRVRRDGRASRRPPPRGPARGSASRRSRAGSARGARGRPARDPSWRGSG